MSRSLLCCVVLVWASCGSLAQAQEEPLDTGAAGRAILVRDIGGHTALPRHVIFTPDSKRLISTGDDRTVQVWDVLTRERLRVFRLPLGTDGQGGLAPWPTVQGLPLVVDRQGEQVAFCVSAKGDAAKERVRWSYSHGYFEKTDGTSWTEKTQTGNYPFVETNRTDSAVEIFDKSRNYTIWLHGDHCKVKRGKAEPTKLYDGTWGTLSTFVCSLASGQAQVLKRVGPRDFSLDGKSLVVAEGKLVQWVDIATDTPRVTRTIPSSSIVCNLALSPDGSTLAVVAQDAKVYLLDAAALTLKKTVTVAGASNLRTVGWADEMTLVCRSGSKNALLVVDAATGAVKHTYQADLLLSHLPKEPENAVVEVHALPGTTKAFVRTERPYNHPHRNNGFLFDWSTGQAAGVYMRETSFGCRAAAIAPDMSVAAQCDGDVADIILWDPQTGKPFREGKSELRLRAAVRGADGIYNSVRWRLDGKGFLWQQLGEIPRTWAGPHQFDLTKLTKQPVAVDAFNKVSKDNVVRVLGNAQPSGELKNVLGNERGIRWKWDNLSLKSTDREAKVVGANGEPVIFKGMVSICTWDLTFVEGGRVAYHPWGSNLTVIYDSATGKSVHGLRPVRSHILNWAVSPQPADRYLLIGSADQTLTVYNTATNKVLLTFFPTRQDWIVWTPEGYYAATPGGERLMGWHVDNGPDKLGTFYPAERFRSQLYRPDVIKLVLEKGSVEEALKAANAALPPELRPKSNAVVDIAKLLPPGTTLKRLSVSDKGVVKLSTDVVAEPGGEGVKSLRLMVDGRPASGKEFFKEFDKPQAKIMDHQWPDLQLPLGKHRVVVLARAADSSSTSNVLEIDTRPTKDRPTLHVLAIGVSKYKDKDLDLKCAANDAKLMEQTFAQCQGPLFGQVRTKVLPNEQATRDKIIAAIAELRTDPDYKVKDGDLVVVFFAGHGVMDQGEFYLLPHDTVLNNLAKTALSGAKLQDELKALSCQVLLMMDACHAAGFGAQGKLAQKNLRPATDMATRKMTEDEVAVVVMCAAMGNEKAIERGQNGLFTKAVAAALTAKGGVPCNPVNHKQYLHHLQSFVFDQVMLESEDRQHPFLHLPWVVESFPLRQVPESASQKQ